MRYIRTIESFNRSAIRETPDSFWHLYGSILSKIFGEIANDDDLLEQCYSPIRSRDFDEQFILSITTGIPGALLCPGNFSPSSFLNERLPSIQDSYHPYLIIGDVGSGKTTFINHFFKIEAKKLHLDDRIEGLLIDLREIGSEDADILDILENKVDAILTTKYPDISKPDLNFGLILFDKELACSENLYLELEKLVDKKAADTERLNDILKNIRNKRAFNAARIRYITNVINKKVYLIFDNVDHYSLDFQNRAFGVGSGLRAEYNCPIIMTTRSYTVPTALTHSWISAYQPRFLNLSSPNIKELLKKRIDYALSSTVIKSLFEKIGKNEIQIESLSGKKLLFDIDSLNELLKFALDSLLSEELLNFIERMAGGDYRYMLKMIRVALSSGYIYPEERQEKYSNIRYYDFLRAIMLGNNLYYVGDNPSTLIINLFDNEDKQSPFNNLIRLRTLQALDIFSNKVFVPKLIETMEVIGYPKDAVKSVLDLFLEAALVEAPHYEGTKINDHISFIRLTFKGREYLNSLCSETAYLDCIKHSSFMSEEYHNLMMELYEKKDIAKANRIKNRLDSTEVFITYLIEQEEIEGKRVEDLGEEAKKQYTKFPKIGEIILPPFNQTRSLIMSRQK
ncbi:MAG: hypothetical protein KKC46_19885 [Proteobacteria bacterium]|nr:hypothetical protein [Pseudomonadota bacterium]